ncbi:MAG: hypothetical protein BGO12_06245 [Verrucomicrobia bacterium 61-8]|nr:GntR family transcriptional regulator [Verrucomicrobiota bacterium]OJV13106.1 MAG: hypothetical protein BGO12_06245 [Verrucomicrobia bacterium 61-8]
MEPFLPNYKNVANLMRRRILHGAYALKSIPSERQLAEEIGVNYMSVRRGLRLLEKDGLLMRGEDGRIEIRRARQGQKTHFNFGLLMPTFKSSAMGLWRIALEKACSRLPCNIRPVVYLHWDDPVLLSAIKGFDGIFLSPLPAPLPESLAIRLRPPTSSVVVLDEDFSGYGIPSIQIFPSLFIHRLLDHLKALGHKKIGCLSTQPDNPEIRERINQWRLWKEMNGIEGALENHPVPPHGDPIQQAYKIMSRRPLDAREETGWFCTTTPAALGLMSALTDLGRRIGHEIAVCSANGEGIAAMFDPPLTALEAHDPGPFINQCLDWMTEGGQIWRGPLLMRPTDVPLAIRGTTVPGAGSFAGAPPIPPFQPLMNEAAIHRDL